MHPPGRRSLRAELISTLPGAWRADGDPLTLAPQQGLDQLPRLLADTRAAGTPVAFHVEGEAIPLPPGVDLAAYRIVQEALTNVRRHSAGGADVVLRYRPDCLALEVVNSGQVTGRTDAAGHGLVGMRERVLLYGGTLDARPGPDGRFAVHASLPVRERATS